MCKQEIMNIKSILFLLFLVLNYPLEAQTIYKPRGCFAGTNGYQSAVLSHPEARGVLISMRWSEIETAPGVFDFSELNSNINLVRSAGLKYSLAILGGAVGSPSWLVDTFNADSITFTFRGSPAKLPFWWDTVVKNRLQILITELGVQFSHDTSLSHVYVTQMTTNGVEGHLNAVNMNDFMAAGYTNQKWIDAAKWTVYKFADVFPEKPLVFEIHEINNEAYVPSVIINDLYADDSLCQRVGLGMWWISGRTDYQAALLSFIGTFQGDKYAQVIGRSTQPERFRDGLYSNAFTQAKALGIRYIEPWPYEFQNHTHDDLLLDFNTWADLNFTGSATCATLSTDSYNQITENKMSLFPNPTSGTLTILIPERNNSSEKVLVFSVSGSLIKEIELPKNGQINVSELEGGLYFIRSKSDIQQTLKFIKR
jgi:hypothetical protein